MKFLFKLLKCFLIFNILFINKNTLIILLSLVNNLLLFFFSLKLDIYVRFLLKLFFTLNCWWIYFHLLIIKFLIFLLLNTLVLLWSLTWFLHNFFDYFCDVLMRIWHKYLIKNMKKNLIQFIIYLKNIKSIYIRVMMNLWFF